MPAFLASRGFVILCMQLQQEICEPLSLYQSMLFALASDPHCPETEFPTLWDLIIQEQLQSGETPEQTTRFVATLYRENNRFNNLNLGKFSVKHGSLCLLHSSDS
jgi:hypothetical protein